MKYKNIFLIFILYVAFAPLAGKATGQPILLGLNPINYTDGPNENDLEEAVSLGAKSIRIWVQWRKIEAEKGQYTWSSLDKIVSFCEKKEIEPWFLVAGAPQHACKSGQLDETADKLCPPKIEPYKIFLTKLVQRYQNRVRYYEIWNEPDDKHYWITKPKAKEYAELLRISHSIIKGIDNKGQIIMAGTAGTNLPFMREVLDRLGGKSVFDAVASHPYRWADDTGLTTAGPYERHWVSLPEGGDAAVQVDLKEELFLYKKLLEDYGYKNVPHWITEYGYPAHDDKGGEGYLTLKQQANFLRQTVELVEKDPDLKFVKGLFWFCDRDWATDPKDPVAKNDFGFFGLLWADHKWKPAAHVFKELAVRVSSGLPETPTAPKGN